MKGFYSPFFVENACDPLFRFCAIRYKEQLGSKIKRTCGGCTLATFYGVLHRHAVFIPAVPFPMLPNILVMQSGIGICYHTAKVFTGSERAVKFEPQAVATKILPLSLSGERNFCAKLDIPKPYTMLAYETKMTDPTDDAYKKSQHDEEW